MQGLLNHDFGSMTIQKSDLQSLSNYLGKLSKVEVERLLLNQISGTYILSTRDEKRNIHRISVRMQDDARDLIGTYHFLFQFKASSLVLAMPAQHNPGKFEQHALNDIQACLTEIKDNYGLLDDFEPYYNQKDFSEAYCKNVDNLLTSFSANTIYSLDSNGARGRLSYPLEIGKFLFRLSSEPNALTMAYVNSNRKIRQFRFFLLEDGEVIVTKGGKMNLSFKAGLEPPLLLCSDNKELYREPAQTNCCKKIVELAQYAPSQSNENNLTEWPDNCPCCNADDFRPVLILKLKQQCEQWLLKNIDKNASKENVLFWGNITEFKEYAKSLVSGSQNINLISYVANREFVPVSYRLLDGNQYDEELPDFFLTTSSESYSIKQVPREDVPLITPQEEEKTGCCIII